MSAEPAALRLPTDAPTGKVARRRAELAEAALITLAQRGYANTSLREIAARSAYSHGIFHYYFVSKDDLILECVRAYRDACATVFEGLAVEVDGRCDPSASAALRTRFGRRLSSSLTHQVGMNRLWYDLRCQTMFSDTLRAETQQVDAELGALLWQVILAYATLLGTEPALDPATSYAAFDGVLHRAVIDHSAGCPDAAAVLADRAEQLLQLIVPARALS